jgi:subtilisin family serine protease
MTSDRSIGRCTPERFAYYNHGMSYLYTRRPLLIRGLLAIFLLLALSLQSGTVGLAALDREPSTLLVRLPDDVPPEQASAYLVSLGLEALVPIPRIHVWRARPLTGSQVSLETLRQRLADEVEWIEPDGMVYAQNTVPNDPYYGSLQWNLALIGLEQAWNSSRGDGVTVAIIDSGIDLVHPDLSAKLWVNPGEIPGTGQDNDGNGYADDVHGYDFVDRDGHPHDLNGHGTHVAGIAGAHTNNGVGVAGVGWEARLMALRVLDAAGNGSWSNVAEAIIYAADNGARVINLSLVSSSYSQTAAEAVVYAQGRGCLVVAAAGNSLGPILYPAALEGVMAVAATTSLDQPAINYASGPQMDVAAPGVSIYSTYTRDAPSSYSYASGTSMAAPHVAGLAALVWAYDPTLTAAQVSQVITSTAHDVHSPGWDEQTGWGRIDARAALMSLRPLELDHRHYLPLLLRAH